MGNVIFAGLKSDRKFKKNVPSSVQMEAVAFQRTKGGDWEYGIMFGGDKLIIDAECKPVDNLFTWTRTGDFLFFHHFVNAG